ncbi:MAG: hypothetical protein HN398_04585 [Thiotrichales bacterium]|nr:hypothetical protein [Thiotrichales bacterium]
MIRQPIGKKRSKVHLTSLLDLLFIMIFIALIQPKKASDFDKDSIKKELEPPTAEEVQPVEQSTAGEDVFYHKVMVFNEYNDETNQYISTRTLYKNDSGRCFMRMARVRNGTRMVNEGNIEPMTADEYKWMNDPAVQQEYGRLCEISLALPEMVLDFDSGTTVACQRRNKFERYLCEWKFQGVDPIAPNGEPKKRDLSYWEPFQVFKDEHEQILVDGDILYWIPPNVDQQNGPPQRRKQRYRPRN